MKNLLKDKFFILGSIIGLSFFVLANYYDYQINNMFSCDDCILSMGFTFIFYREGGFVTIKEVLWIGLISDIFTAILISFSLGLGFKFIWSKLQEKQLK